MQNEQCPLCFGGLEVREVAPCEECGGDPQEIAHFRLNEYRITKYDPRLRDLSGAYVATEWTSYSDVGRSVSLEDYLTTEDRYIEAAVAFLHEAGVRKLEARGVESRRSPDAAPLEGAILDASEWATVFRLVLREEMWCRFESDAGFVHFGYDYYMYVGVSCECPAAHAATSSSGLFIEPWTSPYHPEDKVDDEG